VHATPTTLIGHRAPPVASRAGILAAPLFTVGDRWQRRWSRRHSDPDSHVGVDQPTDMHDHLGTGRLLLSSSPPIRVSPFQVRHFGRPEARIFGGRPHGLRRTCFGHSRGDPYHPRDDFVPRIALLFRLMQPLAVRAPV
jgi:hypothetical protein